MTKEILEDLVVPPPPPPPDFAGVKEARAKGRRIAAEQARRVGALLRDAASQLDIVDLLSRNPGLTYGLLRLLALKRNDNIFVANVETLGDDWFANEPPKTPRKKPKSTLSASMAEGSQTEPAESPPAAAEQAAPTRVSTLPEIIDVARPLQDEPTSQIPNAPTSITAPPTAPLDVAAPGVIDGAAQENHDLVSTACEPFAVKAWETIDPPEATTSEPDSGKPDSGKPAPYAVDRKYEARGSASERRHKMFKLGLPAVSATETAKEESEEEAGTALVHGAPDVQEPSPAPMS